MPDVYFQCVRCKEIIRMPMGKALSYLLDMYFAACLHPEDALEIGLIPMICDECYGYLQATSLREINIDIAERIMKDSEAEIE